MADMHSRVKLANGFVEFLRDIKISHSVFALPFAIAGILLCDVSRPSIRQWLLILLAMVAARSFAMGANRFLDGRIDARNPRTQSRAIPAGHLKPRQTLIYTLGFGFCFVIIAFLLSPSAGKFSLGLLAILWSYSYCKRFSFLSHYFLGICLGLVPVAVCIALGTMPSLGIIGLGMAIMFWVGGFDILYAMQDVVFDKREGLYSLPSKFGIRVSLTISRISFVISLILFLVSGTMLGLSVIYRLGWFLILVILTYEHWLVRDISSDGQTKGMNLAFFNANAAVSLIFLAAVILDRLVYGG